MSVQRRALDHEHPCLAVGCGAPWIVTEQRIDVAEMIGVMWTPLKGECSRGVLAHNIDDYNDGLAARREKGW